MSAIKMKKNQENTSLNSTGEKKSLHKWPVNLQRERVKWFPARYRLISLVRTAKDSFVLPPAVVRKAAWRE